MVYTERGSRAKLREDLDQFIAGALSAKPVNNTAR
jgi:hypothetical protein